MIELYLSSDGKHTVHAKADTPEQMNELASHAKALYEAVLSEYGTKAQMWGKAGSGRSDGQARKGRRVDTVEQARQAVAPRCPEHQTPMAYRQGRYGAFWSCPRKQPDGSWCEHTSKVARQGDGQQQTHRLHAQA